MSLKFPETDLAEVRAVKALIVASPATPSSLLSPFARFLIRRLRTLQVHDLSGGASSELDPLSSALLSSGSLPQHFCLRFAFVTPQYVEDAWSALSVHLKVLVALAVHAPTVESLESEAELAKVRREALCEAARLAAHIRREYPSVLVVRVFVRLPKVEGNVLIEELRQESLPPSCFAEKRTSPREGPAFDVQVCFVGHASWQLAVGGVLAEEESGSSEADADVSSDFASLEGFKECFSSLGESLMRGFLRLLADPSVSSPSFENSAFCEVASSMQVAASATLGQTVGTRGAAGATAEAAASRLVKAYSQKREGDVLLLAGIPEAAAQRYLAAAEAAKALGDLILQAAAIQGQAAAVYAFALSAEPNATTSSSASSGSLNSNSNFNSNLSENSSSSKARLAEGEVGEGLEGSSAGMESSSLRHENSSATSSSSCARRFRTQTPNGDCSALSPSVRSASPPPSSPDRRDSPPSFTRSSSLPPEAGEAMQGRGSALQASGKEGATGYLPTHSLSVAPDATALLPPSIDAIVAFGKPRKNATTASAAVALLGATGASSASIAKEAGSSAAAFSFDGSRAGPLLVGTNAGTACISGHSLTPTTKTEDSQLAAARSEACLDAAVRRLREALLLLQASPQNVAFYCRSSILLAGVLARLGRRQQFLQHVAVAAEQAKRLQVEEFAFCLVALAGCCILAGAFRRLAFLLHRVCMALMEDRRWEAAHFTAVLAAPCFGLVALRTPNDRLKSELKGESPGASRSDLAFVSALHRLLLLTSAGEEEQLGRPNPQKETLLQDGIRHTLGVEKRRDATNLFMERHYRKLRFESSSQRVSWPALQSRLLHVLKVSAEQQGDLRRVAWYSFAALNLLFPVMDAKAQANAALLVHAAAGKRAPPLALPPVLSVWRCRNQKALGENLKSAVTRGAVTEEEDSISARPTGSALPACEKAFFVGGICSGSVAPLPLLMKLVPLMERSQGARNCVTRIQRRVSLLDGKTEASLSTEEKEGRSSDARQTQLVSATASSNTDVLMFNPFRKSGRRQGASSSETGAEGGSRVEAAGLWVEGELRSVQVAVGNPLAVQVVLDRVKVLLFGARTEVYPVTVLVPPSTSHAVTFEVTVLPLETGSLYFAGISYTLNRAHCCQLLARQTPRLVQLLQMYGLLESASFTPSPNAPPGVDLLTLRSNLDDESRLSRIAMEVMEYSAASCVEVIEPLPLLRVSLDMLPSNQLSASVLGLAPHASSSNPPGRFPTRPESVRGASGKALAAEWTDDATSSSSKSSESEREEEKCIGLNCALASEKNSEEDSWLHITAGPPGAPLWSGQERVLYIQLENVGKSFVGVLHFDICAPLSEQHLRTRQSRSKVSNIEFDQSAEFAERTRQGQSGRGDGDGPEAFKEVEAREELKKHFQVLWCPTSPPPLLGPSGTLVYIPNSPTGSQGGFSGRSATAFSSVSSPAEKPRQAVAHPGVVPLLQPLQRVRIPLRCLASEEYPSCLIRIRYSTDETNPYERVALLPVSLSVQKGLKIQSAGFALLPAVHFNPGAALSSLLNTRQLDRRVAEEVKKCVASEDALVPFSRLSRASSPREERRNRQKAHYKICKFKGQAYSAPPRPALQHSFDGTHCFICLKVCNEASVEFECEALGRRVKAPSLCVGPLETQSNWLLLTRRPIRSDVRRLGLRRVVALLDRLLRLTWRAFPMQQGSLRLFDALLKDDAAVTPGAKNGASRRGTGTQIGKRGRNSLDKTDSRERTREARSLETSDRFTPLSADCPRAEAELVQRLQLFQLEVPKVSIYLLLEGATPLAVKRSGLAVSDSYRAKLHSALTLSVFARNAYRFPLSDVWSLLMPFVAERLVPPEGLLWSGSLCTRVPHAVPSAAKKKTEFAACKKNHSKEDIHDRRSDQRKGQEGQEGEEPQELQTGADLAEKAKRSLEEKGAVLCHRISLLPVAPGVYTLAAALFCRGRGEMHWHRRPLRIVV